MLEERIISGLGIHEINGWRSAWDAAKPFHFVVIDEFLEKDYAPEEKFFTYQGFSTQHKRLFCNVGFGRISRLNLTDDGY